MACERPGSECPGRFAMGIDSDAEREMTVE